MVADKLTMLARRIRDLASERVMYGSMSYGGVDSPALRYTMLPIVALWILIPLTCI